MLLSHEDAVWCLRGFRIRLAADDESHLPGSGFCVWCAMSPISVTICHLNHLPISCCAQAQIEVTNC